MHVVWADCQFQHFPFIYLATKLYHASDTFCDLSRQHSLPIFWYEDKVVTEIAPRVSSRLQTHVCSLPLLRHSTNRIHHTPNRREISAYFIISLSTTDLSTSKCQAILLEYHPNSVPDMTAISLTTCNSGRYTSALGSRTYRKFFWIEYKR